MNKQLDKLVKRGFSPLGAYSILRKLAAVEELEHWARSVPPMESEEKQGWMSARGRILQIAQKAPTPEDAASMINGLLEMVPSPQNERDRGRLRGFNEALDALSKGTYTGAPQEMDRPPNTPNNVLMPGNNPIPRQDSSDAWSPGQGSDQVTDMGLGTSRMSSLTTLTRVYNVGSDTRNGEEAGVVPKSKKGKKDKVVGSFQEPKPYPGFQNYNKDIRSYEPMFYDRPVGEEGKIWITSEGQPYCWKTENLRPTHMEMYRQLLASGLNPQVAGGWVNDQLEIYETDEEDMELARIAFPEMDQVMTPDGPRELNLKVAEDLHNLPPTFDSRALFDLRKYIDLKGETINWDAFRQSSTATDQDIMSMLEILTEVGVVTNADQNRVGGLFIINSAKLEDILRASDEEKRGRPPEKVEEPRREDSGGF